MVTLASPPIFITQEEEESTKQVLPQHVIIDSESMQEDSTNITIDEEEEDPFKDLGPVIIGNIVEYSNTTENEGEEEDK